MNEYGPHWHLSEQEAARYNFRARDALQYTLRRQVGTFFGDSIRYLEERAGDILSRGEWSESLHASVLEINNQYGTPAAARYLEPIDRRRVYDGIFDVEEYTAHVKDVYAQTGKRVGARFIWSYTDVLRSGFDPAEYARLVLSSVEQGGRLFGARYARRFGQYVRLGGDPQELLNISADIHQQTDAKFIDKFMVAGTRIAPTGSLEDLAHDTEIGIHSVGRDTMYWGLPAMANIQRGLGYRVAESVRDCIDVQAVTDQKTAQWYAYGLEAYSLRFDQISNIKDPQKASRFLEALNPQAYRDGFIRAYQKWGKGGAVTYCRLFQPSEPERLIEDIEHFEQVASRKLLKETLWRAPMIIGQFDGGISELLSQMENMLLTYSDEDVVQALRYTTGIKRSEDKYLIVDRLYQPWERIKRDENEEDDCE